MESRHHHSEAATAPDSSFFIQSVAQHVSHRDKKTLRQLNKQWCSVVSNDITTVRFTRFNIWCEPQPFKMKQWKHDLQRLQTSFPSCRQLVVMMDGNNKENGLRQIAELATIQLPLTSMQILNIPFKVMKRLDALPGNNIGPSSLEYLALQLRPGSDGDRRLDIGLRGMLRRLPNLRSFRINASARSGFGSISAGLVADASGYDLLPLYLPSEYDLDESPYLEWDSVWNAVTSHGRGLTHLHLGCTLLDGVDYAVLAKRSTLYGPRYTAYDSDGNESRQVPRQVPRKPPAPQLSVLANLQHLHVEMVHQGQLRQILNIPNLKELRVHTRELHDDNDDCLLMEEQPCTVPPHLTCLLYNGRTCSCVWKLLKQLPVLSTLHLHIQPLFDIEDAQEMQSALCCLPEPTEIHIQLKNGAHDGDRFHCVARYLEGVQLSSFDILDYMWLLNRRDLRVLSTMTRLTSLRLCGAWAGNSKAFNTSMCHLTALVNLRELSIEAWEEIAHSTVCAFARGLGKLEKVALRNVERMEGFREPREEGEEYEDEDEDDDAMFDLGQGFALESMEAFRAYVAYCDQRTG